MRCDVIAEGGRRRPRSKPAGSTGRAIGRHQRRSWKEDTQQSGLAIIAADDLADAAEKDRYSREEAQ